MILFKEVLRINMKAPEGPSVQDSTYNYQCTAEGCSYSKRDLHGIVLHMRTHFVYETAEIGMKKATFVLKDGSFHCLDCDRKTDNKVSFQEHVRHHILEFPYKCGHCKIAVRSIPELRKHSSSAHPKTPLLLVLEETGGELESIMVRLCPTKKTFVFKSCQDDAATVSAGEPLQPDSGCDVDGEPRNFNNELDSANVDTPTGQSHLLVGFVDDSNQNMSSPNGRHDDSQVNMVSSSSHPVLENHGKNIWNDSLIDHWKYERVSQKHVRKPKRSFQPIKKALPFVFKSNDLGTVSNSGLETLNSKENTVVRENLLSGQCFTGESAKFKFCDGRFKCLTCSEWATKSEDLFKAHIWKHIHGNVGVCPSSCQISECPFIFGILTLLKSNEHEASDRGSSFTSGEMPICCDYEDKDISVSTSLVSRKSRLPNETRHLKGMELENPCDVEPSLPVKVKLSNETEKKLEYFSPEKLQFSHQSLSSLRSKTEKLLHKPSVVASFTSSKSDIAICNIDDDSIGKDCRRAELSTQSAGEEKVVSTTDQVKVCEQVKQRRPEEFVQQVVSGCDYYHIVRDSTPLSTRCEQCSYTCNSAMQLKWHQESSHRVEINKEFSCSECSFSDSSKQILIWHVAHHIGSHVLKFYSCNLCKEQNSSLAYMKRHLLHIHAGNGDFKTEVINVDYMDGIFKCPVCEAGLPWGSLFNRHLALQHKMQLLSDYLCREYDKKVCPDVIQVPKVLLQSCKDIKFLNTVLEKEQKEVYYCSMCDFTTTSSGDYIRHCTSHSKNKCDITDHDERKKSVTEKLSFEKGKSLLKCQNDPCKDFTRSSTLQSANENVPISDGGSLNIHDEKLNGRSHVVKDLEVVQKLGVQPSQAESKPGIQSSLTYQSSKNWIKKYRAPVAKKRTCVSVSPSQVPTLPRNLKNPKSIDFEKSLPEAYVFSEAIKCPKCYYTDRVRLNLIRHYNGHFKDSDNSENADEVTDANSKSEAGLTFSLWDPGNKSNPSDSLKASDSKRQIVGECGRPGGLNNVKRTTESSLQGSKTENSSGVVKESTKEKKGKSRIVRDTSKSSALTEQASNNVFKKTNALETNTSSSSSLGSTPLFGQYLQNHAKKVDLAVNCESCDKTFVDLLDRDKHAAEAHRTTYYICRCCGTMILGLLRVYQHFKEEHPGSEVLANPWTSSNDSRKRLQSDVSFGTLPEKKLKLTDTKASKEKVFNDSGSVPVAVPVNVPVSSMSSPPSTDFSTAGKCKEEPNETNHGRPASGFSGSVGNDLLSVMSSMCPTAQIPAAPVMSAQQPSVPAQIFGSTLTPGSGMMAPTPAQFMTMPGAGLMQPAHIAAGQSQQAAAMTQLMAGGLGLVQPTPPAGQSLFTMLQTTAQIFASQSSNAVSGTNMLPALMQAAMQMASPAPMLNVPMATVPQPQNPELAQIANMFASWLMASLANGSVAGSAAQPMGLSNSSVCGINMENPSLMQVGAHTFGLPPVMQNCGNEASTTVGANSQDRDNNSSKKNLSEHENQCPSDTESVFSSVSQRSCNSKTSSCTTARKPLKRGFKGIGRIDDELSDNSTDVLNTSSSTVDQTEKRVQECQRSSLTDMRSVRFCCTDCSYSASNISLFEHHLSLHIQKNSTADPKSWKPVRQRCGFCSFQTYLEEEFEEHVSTHMIGKPLQCSYCSFSCFAKASILRHLAKRHGTLEPKFDKNKDVRLALKASEGRTDSRVNLKPVVRLKNILKYGKKGIKRLLRRHNLNKINLKV